MTKKARRLIWAAACALGLAATTAAPALAGVAFNHSEPLNGR